MKKAEKNKLRIKDIAELAHVSAGTVDRVLHNRGEVAEETRRQVLSIIDQMGYTPNLLAKSLASKKHYKIAILIPSFENDNPYWEKPLIGIRQAFTELEDFNSNLHLLTFDLNSEQSFWNAFNTVLEQEPDGLIFSPVFYNRSLEIVKICEARDIPFIFIDVNIDSCSNLAYFGQNSLQSGYLAGRLLDYGLDRESTVLILKIASKDGITHHLKKREEGFMSYVHSVGDNRQIKSLEIETSKTGEIEQILLEAFHSSPDIRGIFVTNSKVHLIAGFLEKKRLNNVLLLGYDLIDQNLEYLEKGVIDFLIGQKPEEQGYKSVISLFNYLMAKKTPEKVNYSPIDIIMKENIDYYKNFKY